MVDLEVENVLREIRERVRGQSLERRGAESPPVAGDEKDDAAPLSSSSSSSLDAGARARLEANLTTTERAWNKLPPLMSYRSGWLARLELWLKRQVKRATHWYTWEQVNFNAAVHHALRDALSALAAYEQHIAALQSEIASLRPLRAEFEARHTELNARHAELQARQAELEARQAELDARLSARASQQAAALETGLAALASRLDSDSVELRKALAEIVEQSRRELEGAHAAHATQTEQLRKDLQHELRERIEHVQDEQRVCFKQLSLESSETAVLMDRARRGVETRIGELAARVEELRTEKERGKLEKG